MTQKVPTILGNHGRLTSVYFLIDGAIERMAGYLLNKKERLKMQSQSPDSNLWKYVSL
ncbi:hypothetical protein [Paenisporosarcina antarctica]|uniref:hypothetical protein n=1 Tax=Paenisporosarcina antarctica TaxID=417367 RepID=UPI001417043D|nr:hypothetical protein [Paenisporosarcina antarctica]